METIDSHDLLVIGGGPAGLSAALESSKHGVKTAIIEDLYVEAIDNPSDFEVF